MKTIERDELNSPDAPGDGWYIIEAGGEHPTEKRLTNGEIVQFVQRCTPEALARVVEAGVPPEGVPVDKDHLSLQDAHSTEAMGWVRELALCGGDLAARIEWTPPGQALVKGKVYKHFSTVYPWPGEDALRSGSIEPERLIGLALTNLPNNAAGQPPIANTHEGTETNFLLRQGGEAKTQTNPKQDTKMQYNAELLALLGLAEGATDDEVLARVRALKEGADAAAEAEADALVNSEESKEGVELTEEEKKECREEVVANRARGIRYTSMLCQNKRLTKAATSGSTSQRYAGNGRTPAITNRKGADDQEKAICNRATEIIAEARRNGKDVGWWTAVSQARIENPKK